MSKVPVSTGRKRLEALLVLTRVYRLGDKLCMGGPEDKMLFDISYFETYIEIRMRDGEIIKISQEDFESFRCRDLDHGCH